MLNVAGLVTLIFVRPVKLFATLNVCRVICLKEGVDRNRNKVSLLARIDCTYMYTCSEV